MARVRLSRLSCGRSHAAVVALSARALTRYRIAHSSRAAGAPGWSTWNASRITTDHGYPVFTVEGRPFFVYGAAFFYERMPRDRWHDALLAYRNLGINTIDLYLIWNWHEPAEGVADFTGTTDPRRDLLALLKQTHQLGFKLILRPGPVIRNEWRNGGYPAWLLRRAEYNMPLHDVLEGRYPATATLQNANADAAAAEWLANGTHLRAAAQWLNDALGAVDPYSHDVIAIALDDDQGAYLDNNTWPAPHWHAYIGWLRRTVASIVGNRVPLFINTYEMRVPSASPAWAWGNWYQSSSYRIGAHDLADLDFATGLLQTQRRLPAMQSEFQAGWFQTADEGAPRPSDPSNTAIALGELFRDGIHGVVNFPLQDTIDPHGWEAPWANWSYAWDAALTSELRASTRYAPTRWFGDLIGAYGTLLARTHVAADAAIVWPATLFAPGTLSADDFNLLASATTAMQRTCNGRGLSCTLVDLATIDERAASSMTLLFPPIPSLMGRMRGSSLSRLHALRKAGRLFFDLSSLPAVSTPKTCSEYDVAARRRRFVRLPRRDQSEWFETARWRFYHSLSASKDYNPALQSAGARRTRRSDRGRHHSYAASACAAARDSSSVSGSRWHDDVKCESAGGLRPFRRCENRRVRRGTRQMPQPASVYCAMLPIRCRPSRREITSRLTRIHFRLAHTIARTRAAESICLPARAFRAIMTRRICHAAARFFVEPSSLREAVEN